MDPRGFPTSLPEFQRVFPDDNACADYLEKLRWPEGFVCPKCGWKGEPYRFQTRSAVVLGCRNYRECKANTSLTANTVMQKTHTPLSVWFWAGYLMTTQTPGQSALQFQRQLALPTYNTALLMLHKLRAAMVRPQRDEIGGEHVVEVDECFIGKRGRSGENGEKRMATIVGAVEVRLRKDAEERSAKYRQEHEGGVPLKKLVYAGRLRLRLVDGPTVENLTAFVMENIKSGSTVKTDGSKAYWGMGPIGYKHDPLVVGGDPEKAESHLPMIHLVFSNLKTWILGTHHGAVRKHNLQAYLNEYVFRFNRRFYPMTAFNSVLGLSSHSVSPTYRQFWDGKWAHPQ